MTSGPGEGSNRPARSSSTRPTHQQLPPLRTSAPIPPRSQPLLLTVRFSNSLPDLLLDVSHPATTTIAALKHLIRSRLTEPTSQRRLRFIHGGRILPESAIVAAVRKPRPPPPRDPRHAPADPKGKGKAVDPPAAQRVYVNCSIGDQLTTAELDEERRRAEEPAAAAAARGSSPLPLGGAARRDGGGGGGGDGRTTTAATTATTDQDGPRGFDRLLVAGFTAAEVNALRLQHRSIQAARHTADTLPSPDTLRGMEDAWLDNNNDVAGGGGGGLFAAGAGGSLGGNETAAAGAGGVGDEFGLAGILDLLLKGMFVGFVWPLGAIGWLVRDEEKIPKRMRVFVYFGFVLSLLIGTIRVIG